MSATGRTREDGPSTVRLADDNYETPAWCVRAIWPHVRPVSGLVLEPCAGRGAIVEVISDSWATDLIHARELDQKRADAIPLEENVRCCDWLSYTEALKPKLVITNPPYKLALEFVAKSIALQQPHGGTTCMLLRLNFLGSQKRGQWLKDHLPDVYVLSKRPSFCTYISENEDKKAPLVRRAKWWNAFSAVSVGVPDELVELREGTDKEIAVAPSRVSAVQEWCARLPGWDAGPLAFRSGTDACEYAWFFWGPRARGRIHILDEKV